MSLPAPTWRAMPDLWRHLALCADCREEYEALRDLAQLDAGARLPNLSTLRRQLGVVNNTPPRT